MWYTGCDGEAQVWDLVAEDLVYLFIVMDNAAGTPFCPGYHTSPSHWLAKFSKICNMPLSLPAVPNLLIFSPSSTLLILTVLHLHWPFLPVLFTLVMLLLFSFVVPLRMTWLIPSLPSSVCWNAASSSIIKAFLDDAIIFLNSLHGILFWFLCVISIWHILSVDYFLLIRMNILWR